MPRSPDLAMKLKVILAQSFNPSEQRDLQKSNIETLFRSDYDDCLPFLDIYEIAQLKNAGEFLIMVSVNKKNSF